MKNLIAMLAAAEAAGRFQFLLIGGYGLGAHKLQRDTRDVDFLIASDDLAKVEDIVLALGYVRLPGSSSAFRQYSHPDQATVPVDLMLVNSGTFGKLAADSIPMEFLGASLRAPSVASFIALKLHALRWNPRREAKDMADISMLLRLNPGTVGGERLKELCDRYAPPGYFERLKPLVS
jgi:hypothetical protein